MSLNIEKGERIEITKTNPGLTKLFIGGGWDVNRNASGNYDLDIFAFLLYNDSKLGTKDNVIYFGQKKHPSGSVEIEGKDNLTGEGGGDDEKILVDLSKIPLDIEEVVFFINIYQAEKRKQNFGMINNAYIRVVNQDGNKEIMRFNLTEDYSKFHGVVVGKIYRYSGEWKFTALGNGFVGDINTIAKQYGLS